MRAATTNGGFSGAPIGTDFGAGKFQRSLAPAIYRLLLISIKPSLQRQRPNQRRYGATKWEIGSFGSWFMVEHEVSRQPSLLSGNLTRSSGRSHRNMGNVVNEDA